MQTIICLIGCRHLINLSIYLSIKVLLDRELCVNHVTEKCISWRKRKNFNNKQSINLSKKNNLQRLFSLKKIKLALFYFWHQNSRLFLIKLSFFYLMKIKFFYKKWVYITFKCSPLNFPMQR